MHHSICDHSDKTFMYRSVSFILKIRLASKKNLSFQPFKIILLVINLQLRTFAILSIDNRPRGIALSGRRSFKAFPALEESFTNARLVRGMQLSDINSLDGFKKFLFSFNQRFRQINAEQKSVRSFEFDVSFLRALGATLAYINGNFRSDTGAWDADCRE